MNQRTIGAGVRTERRDDEHLAKVLAIKEKLSDDPDKNVKVETLSPIQAAELELEQAARYRDELDVAMATLAGEFLKAEESYKSAHRKLLALRRKRGR